MNGPSEEGGGSILENFTNIDQILGIFGSNEAPV